jgi:AcrR family transcriptional regulator
MTKPGSAHLFEQRRKRGRPPDPVLRAKKHARMLNVAMELFIARGYESVSVEQIAQTAGQSKGAFYWYFNDKEDCLSQITAALSNKMADALSRQLQKGGTHSEKLLHASDFRNWGDHDFSRYALLVDSMIYGSSASVRALGVETAGQIYRSLFKTLTELGPAAAAEAGWSQERIAAFNFNYWACCCLACYAGLFEFLNQKYLPFTLETRGLADAIHAAFVSPIVGAAKLNWARTTPLQGSQSR